MFAIATNKTFVNRLQYTSSDYASKSLLEINLCSIYNVPKNATFFFSAILMDDNRNSKIAQTDGFVAKKVFCWDYYVSEFAKNLINQQLNQESYKNLKYLDLAHKFHEDNIAYSLLRDEKIKKSYFCDHLKW
jgi:hypothetical protein